MSQNGRCPPPPPLPACCPQTLAGPAQKRKLYQTIASGRTPVEGDYTEARVLLGQREARCGLVALWMAAHLRQPQLNIDMETVTQTALNRAYTAQGEMFSAQNMALLAEEICCCRAQLLSGGLRDNNALSIIKHLWDRQPVLIPYDEDFNHAPCKRSGHKAHWAVASGVLLGLDHGSLDKQDVRPDPSLPWLYLPTTAGTPCPLSNTLPREVYILAKQGKSLRYQIWSLDCIAESNDQLRTMDPQRENNGTQYVLPEGGVEAGLLGQAVMLHTRSLKQ
ncbi:actin maturation protease isoform X2 [Eucyclogobius newberryi]|uniref:actin maturation protease isoform X2 n=1 Tax=Eucyclogobius newberryi TaxID=166745 RepID=UPI003B5BF899